MAIIEDPSTRKLKAYWSRESIAELRGWFRELYFPLNSKYKDKDIRKIFPPKKRKSYLNYLLIVCGNNHDELASCLSLYCVGVLNGPWKEAEPHIIKHSAYYRIYSSRILHTWRRWNIFYLPFLAEGKHSK